MNASLANLTLNNIAPRASHHFSNRTASANLHATQDIWLKGNFAKLALSTVQPILLKMSARLSITPRHLYRFVSEQVLYRSQKYELQTM